MSRNARKAQRLVVRDLSRMQFQIERRVSHRDVERISLISCAHNSIRVLYKARSQAKGRTALIESNRAYDSYQKEVRVETSKLSMPPFTLTVVENVSQSHPLFENVIDFF